MERVEELIDSKIKNKINNSIFLNITNKLNQEVDLTCRKEVHEKSSFHILNIISLVIEGIKGERNENQ